MTELRLLVNTPYKSFLKLTGDPVHATSLEISDKAHAVPLVLTSPITPHLFIPPLSPLTHTTAPMPSLPTPFASYKSLAPLFPSYLSPSVTPGGA